MLKDILRFINDSGMISVADIAEKAGTTQSMVEQAISLLLSRGYLTTPAQANCPPAHCAGCHKCSTAPQMSGYFVTEKGKKYLQST
jgi:FeoC like transcriptional regulator.